MKSLTFVLLLSGCTAWRRPVRKEGSSVTDGGSFVDEQAEGFALSNAGKRRRRRRRDNGGAGRRRRYDGGGGGNKPSPPTPSPPTPSPPTPSPNDGSLRAVFKRSGSCQHIFNKEDCLAAAKQVAGEAGRRPGALSKIESKSELDKVHEWACGEKQPCGCTIHDYWKNVEWWGGAVVGNAACGFNEYNCVCSVNAARPPAPTPELPNCGSVKPTYYYPLPDNTGGDDNAFIRGIPSPMLAHPPFMSMCDVKRLQDICVAQINKYRANTVPFGDGRFSKHGPMRALHSSDKANKCANQKALSDLLYSVHQGAGCGHHSPHLNCGIGMGGAENSCCPRHCDSFDGCKNQLLNCLQGMWNEGERVLNTGNNDWGLAGHYWNMLGTASYVACGFGFDSQGGFMATQTFFPR